MKIVDDGHPDRVAGEEGEEEEKDSDNSSNHTVVGNILVEIGDGVEG